MKKLFVSAQFPFFLVPSWEKKNSTNFFLFILWVEVIFSFSPSKSEFTIRKKWKLKVFRNVIIFRAIFSRGRIVRKSEMWSVTCHKKRIWQFFPPKWSTLVTASVQFYFHFLLSVILRFWELTGLSFNEKLGSRKNHFLGITRQENWIK